MPTENYNRNFPEYEILSELGRSTARVLKARHKGTGKIVAIKHFWFNVDEEIIRRFQQESTIMTQLQHPNIVKVHEVCLDAETPYIAMEIVEGGDLESLLKEKTKLDVPNVIRLALQIGEALKEIHEKGIIHRDIKSANIMYRELQNGEYHFLLTDFGIAKLPNTPKTIGYSPMTCEYASPEQYNQLENVTQATDYYSLGVVLYECLSGQVPFPMGSKGVGAFSKAIETELPPAIQSDSFIPPTLLKLIDGLLDKNVAERIISPQILKKMLKKADMEWDEKDEENNENINTKPEINLNFTKKDEVVATKKGDTPNVVPVKKSTSLIPFITILGLIGIVVLGIYLINPATNEQTAVDSTATPIDSVFTSEVDSVVTPVDTSNYDYILGSQLFVKGEYFSAMEHFKQAVENTTDGKAENYIGYMYNMGLGVPQNYSQAKDWYEKADIKGNSDARCSLGVMYYSGNGVEQSYEEAKRLYELAVANGHDMAQNNLGLLYEYGFGTTKNIKEAIRLYKLSAAQGNSEAIANLKRLTSN